MLDFLRVFLISLATLWASGMVVTLVVWRKDFTLHRVIFVLGCDVVVAIILTVLYLFNLNLTGL